MLQKYLNLGVLYGAHKNAIHPSPEGKGLLAKEDKNKYLTEVEIQRYLGYMYKHGYFSRTKIKTGIINTGSRWFYNYYIKYNEYNGEII